MSSDMVKYNADILGLFADILPDIDPAKQAAFAEGAREILAQAKAEIGLSSPGVRGIFGSGVAFDAAQRIAKCLAASDLVPKQYQGNVANCIVALELSVSLGASPLMVMQSLNVIHGRPSWSAQFLIATVNTCGRFSPIRYKFTGELGKPNRGCAAYATERASGEVCWGSEVNLELARIEGWSTKPGNKWVTMPEQMLMYRAAAFWIRTYAPELSLGMHTTEEVQDIGPLPTQQGPQPEAGLLARLRASPDRVVGPSGVPTYNHIGSVTANRMTIGAPLDEDVATPQYADPPCREPGEEG